MDPKKQKKYINKCLRVLKGKNAYKIKSFTTLAKAIKISIKTFRFYELNKLPEIIETLKKNRHENSPQKSVINREKVPQKNVENEKKFPIKNVQEKPIRSYEEINAKLFGYQAFKKKNYARLTLAAKRLLDRQIGLLEWVLKKDKDAIGEENGNQDSQ